MSKMVQSTNAAEHATTNNKARETLRMILPTGLSISFQLDCDKKVVKPDIAQNPSRRAARSICLSCLSWSSLYLS